MLNPRDPNPQVRRCVDTGVLDVYTNVYTSLCVQLDGLAIGCPKICISPSLRSLSLSLTPTLFLSHSLTYSLTLYHTLTLSPSHSLCQSSPVSCPISPTSYQLQLHPKTQKGRERERERKQRARETQGE